MQARDIPIRKCKICGDKFEKMRMGQIVCSIPCAAQFALQKKARQEAKNALAERKLTREKLDKLKTKQELAKECQQAVNAYVRARDINDPCISCQRHHAGQYHAGHYLSTGARPNLRFDLDNIHKQCQPCNTHLSGNLISYRINLIKKIGLATLERLENDHEPKHYTREELIEMAKHYRKLTRERLKG